MTVSPIARQSSHLTASIAEQKLVGQACIQQILQYQQRNWSWDVKE